MSLLKRLMEEDGVEFESSSTDEYKSMCMFHDEKTASFFLNSSMEIYYCFGCGAHGGVTHYLRKKRGMDNKEIALFLSDEGWSDDRVAANNKRSDSHQKAMKKKRKALPIKESELPRGTAVEGIHNYLSPDGEIIFAIARFRQKNPKVLPYTPCKQGGWWRCLPSSSSIPDEDRVSLLPIYNLPGIIKDLSANPDNQVWVVEGEKCADAINNLHRGGEGQPSRIPQATTLSGGSNTNLEKHDLSPLKGKKIALLADADETGRKFMRRLGNHLYGMGCKISLYLPAGDNGYDAADAISEGGGDHRVLYKWIKESKVDWKPTRKSRASDSDPTETPVDDGLGYKIMSDNEHFKVMGLMQDHVVFLQKRTFQLKKVPQKSVGSQGTLLELADLMFWSMAGPAGQAAMSRNSLTYFTDSILRAAREIGEVNPMNLVGRGACKVSGKFFFNDGQKLLVPSDGQGALNAFLPLDESGTNTQFLPGPPIRVIKRDYSEEKAREWGKSFCKAILKYRWATEMHGKSFLGWIVTSLVGGCLEHRPGLWLVAPGSTGKSYLHDRVLEKIFADCLLHISSTTSAGLSQAIGSDSLPVSIDEFESDKGSGNNYAKDILQLMRMATGGGGYRIRGSMAGGSPTSTKPRFSLFLSSTNQPKLSVPDRTRFFTISLSRKGVDNWSAVDELIKEATDPRKMLMVRSMIIINAPKIAAEAEKIQSRLTDMFGTREAMIMGALSAGYNFLSGENVSITRQEEVEDDANDSSILNYMLTKRVRDEHKSISNMLRRGYWTRIDDSDGGSGFTFSPRNERGYQSREDARAHGFAMLSETTLGVAMNHQPVSELIAGSQYEGVNLDLYLKRLPGAKMSKTKRRFAGSLKPVLRLEGAVLQEIGLLDGAEASLI